MTKTKTKVSKRTAISSEPESPPEWTLPIGNHFPNHFPFDAPDEWWEGDREEPASPPRDWAHAAARGVMVELESRIKLDRAKIDQKTRIALLATMAAIIKAAADDMTYDF